MSLINKMLQDLDSRRAANGPKSGVPNEVRPLPAPGRSSVLPVVGAVTLLLALAGAGFWQYADSLPATLRAAEPAAAPVPAPAVAVTPAPALLPPVDVLPLPAPLPEPPLVSEESAEAGLNLATSLRWLPEREPAPRTASRPPPRPAALPAAPPPTPQVSPAAAPAATLSAGPVRIEKSVASGTAGAPHERAESDYRRALGVLNAGRLIEGIEILRAALKQEAAHSASRQLLFRLLVENSRLDEAGDLLREGLLLQPAQISWAMSLGRLQVDRGDLSGAWQTLQHSSPFAANSADYQGFSGHVLQRLGRSKEAVEHYQAATRLAPSEGRWWLGLGLALEAGGLAAEARDALLRARASGTLNADLIALVDQKLR
jgi:MSHA biogenesis protein MshN